MLPDLFTIPIFNIPVHSYGLMLVLGLLCAMEVGKYLARRSGMDPELFSTASILALISGLIGARIAYVIQNFSDFTHKSLGENIFDAINLTSGGLVYYGGFLFAFGVLVIWAVKKKMPLFRSMDIVAPCLMIGLAFGRVGCFMNGCCYGQHCDINNPFAVRFPYYSEPYMDDYASRLVNPDPKLFERDPATMNLKLIPPAKVQKDAELTKLAAESRSLPVINTQLISTATALMIAIICIFFFTLYAAPGRGFALMMMLEGLSRTLIEGMRVEPTVAGPLTLSMLIGIGVFAGGIALWFVAGQFKGRGLIGDQRGFPVALQ